MMVEKTKMLSRIVRKKGFMVTLKKIMWVLVYFGSVVSYADFVVL